MRKSPSVADHDSQPTADTKETAMQDRIELAVVGAHLRGMPLNGELLALGATFVREGATRPEYRLFALDGTKPIKPGLLRVEEAAGFAILVEVWALDPAAFGLFVSRIPAPLGIGTLRLADGSEAKGFLVEGVAVLGMRDVSRYGGWRAFVASLSAAA